MAKTITLTDKNDKKTGSSADEKILAKGGNDSVDGGAGRDTLDGGSGNDQLTGGADNDTLLGGDGNDTAVYASALEDKHGNRQYDFELNDAGQLRVIDLSKKEGVDTLDSIEFLKFKDGTVAVADILKEINNAPPQLNIDPTSQSVSEGTGSDPTEVTINLQLSEPSDQPVTAHLSTLEGTASPNSDYIPLDMAISFAPGQTEQSLTVLIAADNVKEGDEKFTLKLDQVQGAELAGDGFAQIVIIDDDKNTAPGQVGIQVSDVKIAEGNAGSKTAAVTVSLTGSSSNQVTVDYATLNGSATAGSDYQSKSGTLTFNPGETQKTINITINGDTQVEGDETFTVSLNNPTGAKINTPKATVTITDDDSGVQPSANQPPLAKDDSFTGLPGNQAATQTAASLLKNDSDPDGDTLTLTAVSGAVGGTASLNGDSVVFTPQSGVASGSYQYSVSDGHGGTAGATVTLGFSLPPVTTPPATTPPSNANTSLPADSRTYDLTLPLDDKANSLNGSAMNEKILGMGGNDTLSGNAGNDYLDGGDGGDSLSGGAGDDYLLGGDGADSIDGGDGNNSIDGGDGGDSITAGEGSDYIIGGEGANYIYAGGGNNLVVGGSGDDNITVGSGNDTIYGGEGNNNIRGDYGNKLITTGAGNDTIYASGGNDIINSGAGNDTIEGGSGNDSINAGDGNDNIRGGGQLSGGAGSDYINCYDGGTAHGDAGDDKLEGSGQLYGDAGSDVLNVWSYGNGGDGNDTLVGRSYTGVVLEGGAGVDALSTYYGSASFRYTQASDSGVGLSNRDIITDFDTASGDVIDLGRLSSKPLTFVSTAAFSGKAGEVNFSIDVGNNWTLVDIDLDGNKTADMEIQLTGINILSADDFLLTVSAP